MESKQPPSHGQSDLESPRPEELERSVNAKAAEPNVEDHKPGKPDDPSELEALRLRIRMLTDEKSTSSKGQGISTNPLALVVVGFLLSTIPGGFFTFYYGRLLQELAARRSFSDEVNKIRVQKLGEVWEQLDKDEFAINRLLDDRAFEGANKDSSSNNQRVDDVRRLINDDQAMASKYRFWLGEDMFHKTTGYLDLSVKYALNKLIAPRGTDLSELIKQRDAAKQDIVQIRSLFLEGEPSPESKRVTK
jgi:hypothetical protein